VLPLPPLPVPATALIGRDVELSRLEALVCDSANRLVTLTGVGGGGKTRVALAVAGATAHAFPDGVLWLELAPLSDGVQLPQALAAALGVPEALNLPLLETLRGVLVSRSMLVVLDNCEHLIEPCAMLVAHLLAACPALHVLVTSREPLHIAGEQQWALASLPVPRGRRLRWPAYQPCNCFWSGRGPWRLTLCSPREMPWLLSKSAGAWTGFRSRSSWPLGAFVRSASNRSSAGSIPASRC
jgi:predicted ATPase